MKYTGTKQVHEIEILKYAFTREEVLAALGAAEPSLRAALATARAWKTLHQSVNVAIGVTISQANRSSDENELDDDGELQVVIRLERHTGDTPTSDGTDFEDDR